MARTATARVAGWAALGRADAGFSLAEMIVVAALIAVGTAITIPVTMAMVNRAKNDSASIVAQTFIDSARDRAVAERRNVELIFLPPNRIELRRVEVPSGVRTVVGQMQLESAQQFMRFNAIDTGDGFGIGTANPAGVVFSGPGPVMFTSDGSLIDSNGDVTNGTVFFGVPNKPDSARAITVFGVTGMLRSWKWGGATWMQ
jgi:prepilin-type N-terminal cleavage/methylation domain-containing protein